MPVYRRTPLPTLTFRSSIPRMTGKENCTMGTLKHNKNVPVSLKPPLRPRSRQARHCPPEGGKKSPGTCYGGAEKHKTPPFGRTPPTPVPPALTRIVVPVTPAQGLGSALCPGPPGTSLPSEYFALYATADLGVFDVIVTCEVAPPPEG